MTVGPFALEPDFLEALTARFAAPDASLALLGSHARGATRPGASQSCGREPWPSAGTMHARRERTPG